LKDLVSTVIDLHMIILSIFFLYNPAILFLSLSLLVSPSHLFSLNIIECRFQIHKIRYPFSSFFSSLCLSRDSSLILGVQLCFRRFFFEIRGFIVKNWLYIYDWKYCPSLATTFSHLSDSVRIPRRKNWLSFEAIHESIQFFTSS